VWSCGVGERKGSHQLDFGPGNEDIKNLVCHGKPEFLHKE
jgi:hypothetical protein